MMRMIRQRGAHDCGVAALAMATDRTYEEILALGNIGEIIAANRGLNDLQIFSSFEMLGFSCQQRYGHTFGDGDRTRRRWPCPPFAPSHMAQVRGERHYHFVAMDDAGTFFDPHDHKRGWEDYLDICWITGLWPIPASGPSR